MNNLASIREKLVNHEIYETLNAPEKIRVFMQHHVFAVWDFMSLLKRLQRDLTCVELPWRVKLPTQSTQFARFINEIVIGEETDEDGTGGYISHFELYLQAMRECGADTNQIENFLQQLENNGEVEKSLALAEVPESVAQFVNNTINLAANGKTHEVCASFFFGREELIPDMFQVIVDELSNNGQKPERLLYYLNRHIEMDGDEHGPLTQKLLDYLCDNDEIKIKEAERAATIALNSRIELWNGVCRSLENRSKTASI